jgi:hypothetical protein
MTIYHKRPHNWSNTKSEDIIEVSSSNWGHSNPKFMITYQGNQLADHGPLVFIISIPKLQHNSFEIVE